MDLKTFFPFFYSFQVLVENYKKTKRFRIVFRSPNQALKANLKTIKKRTVFFSFQACFEAPNEIYVRLRVIMLMKCGRIRAYFPGRFARMQCASLAVGRGCLLRGLLSLSKTVCPNVVKSLRCMVVRTHHFFIAFVPFLVHF